jgi:hypothetical protein
MSLISAGSISLDSTFNPASINIFFDFWSNFLLVRPLKMKSENFFFLHQLEVCSLGADRFDLLVLTGVSVAKFLNFATFYLIFLHNTHKLSVCWSVCRSFLCVLSVCMSVLCTVQYVQYV